MIKKIAKHLILALSITIITPYSIITQASTVPEILGVSALTMDINTGEVIYSKNATEERSPASTTKLLSSLLFAETVDRNSTIQYSDVSAGIKETVLGDFMRNPVVAGDSLTAEDVMESVMIYSANDTAVLMAEAVAGTVEDFALMMNERAKELGAVNTTFYNPSGLENSEDPSVNNVTTAYDLALIAIEAYKNDWIRETMALKEATVTLHGLPIYIQPRNLLLGQNGNLGGKTGTETLAEHCFVGFYERDDRELVTVVLGTNYGDGTNVFDDTELIANYSYTATKVPFLKSGQVATEIDFDYKLFGFFGPVSTISIPLTTNENILYYDNDFNASSATVKYTGESISAWSVARNNNINLTFTSGAYNEEIAATAKISIGDLFKINAPVYIATFIFLVMIIALAIVIIRLFLKRNNRKNRYFNKYLN